MLGEWVRTPVCGCAVTCTYESTALLAALYVSSCPSWHQNLRYSYQFWAYPQNWLFGSQSEEHLVFLVPML